MIRQGRKPFSTTSQTRLSGSHSQTANSRSQKSAILAANDIRASRHSAAVRRNPLSTSTCAATAFCYIRTAFMRGGLRAGDTANTFDRTTVRWKRHQHHGRIGVCRQSFRLLKQEASSKSGQKLNPRTGRRTAASQRSCGVPFNSSAMTESFGLGCAYR